MRAVFLTALVGVLAAFVVASPKPASALPAATTKALHHSHVNTDLVEVRKKYKRRYRPYRRYRRPYYRPYRFYGRPYYRPYRYYGRPYYRPSRYYRRPRVGVYIGI